jgi:hypothetical protein
VAAFFYLIAAMASASAQTGGTVPDVEAIAARMAQARAENRGRLRPYIVTREYKLYGKERQATKSELVADVTFVPRTPRSTPFSRLTGAVWEK